MKPAAPERSVLLKFEKLPSRNRMLVGTSVSPVSVPSRTPLPFASKNVEVYIFACHWLIAMSPRLQERCVDPAPGQRLAAPATPSLTGVDSPSTSMSFHWSKTVIRQSPSGSPDSVKVPSALHLVNAKSSPSGSPRLT